MPPVYCVLVTPTTHTQQRKQHKARQARSDALKELRAGQPVWITVPDYDGGGLQRCRVLPVPWEDPSFTFYGGQKALCLVERKLQVATIVEKDGVKVYNSGGPNSGNYHIPFKRIFGIVAEQHAISEDA